MSIDLFCFRWVLTNVLYWSFRDHLETANVSMINSLYVVCVGEGEGCVCVQGGRKYVYCYTLQWYFALSTLFLWGFVVRSHPLLRRCHNEQILTSKLITFVFRHQIETLDASHWYVFSWRDCWSRPYHQGQGKRVCGSFCSGGAEGVFVLYLLSHERRMKKLKKNRSRTKMCNCSKLEQELYL